MTRFQAKINYAPGLSSPDEYNASKSRTPAEDFIVSRHKDGSPLSRYGDISWDRTPYDPEGRAVVLSFKYWSGGELTEVRKDLVNEIRWITFLLIYLRRSPSLSNGSLRNYLKVLHYSARFCEVRKIRVSDLFSEPILLMDFLKDSIHLAKLTKALLIFLKGLEAEIVGFEVANKKSINDLSKFAVEWASSIKQHPPIPTRAYSAILSLLAKEIATFESVVDQLIQLFEECAHDPLTGLAVANQWKKRMNLGLHNEDLRPTFPELLRKHGLEEFWVERGYGKGRRSVCTAFTEIMVTASLQIQAFSGMRAGEVESLPYDCLEEIKREEDGRIHFIVNGHVTKHSFGKRKRAQWVTSESGRTAILLSQRLSQVIYRARSEQAGLRETKPSDHFLFTSPSRAIRDGRSSLLDIRLNRAPHLQSKLPTIEEGDLLELERIDPHRAWRSENAFQVGKQWNLTSHQLRRSLALYAQRSGLVSLPTLKRQLQHITKEMATYYGRGSQFATNFIGIGGEARHFGEEWREAQPVSQYLSCAANVLFTDETLFGVHPHWINLRLRSTDGTLIFDRTATLKRFEKGELAYRETILGGCVKVGECDKSPLDILHVDCITSHCRNMVGNKKKLERVIAVQENLVTKLRLADPKSPEYRYEKSALAVLKSTLLKVVRNAPESGDH